MALTKIGILRDFVSTGIDDNATATALTLGSDASVTITSTDDGSAAAPEFILYRNSASPADADYLGQIQFKGKNDNNGEEIYAKVTGKISDASLGTEDGLIETAIKGDGSFTIVSRQKSDYLQLLNGVGLTVDGNVGVGIDPVYELDILANSGATLRVANETDSTAKLILRNVGSSDGSIYQAGGNMSFDIGGSEIAVLESGGDVGIGVSNPTQRLDVREEKTGGDLLIQVYNTDNSDTTTQTAGLALGPDSRGATAKITAVKENASFATNAGRDVALTFSSVLNNTPTEAMRILSSGDASIGSTSNHTGARVVINDTPPTAFGSPMLQVGQETFTASGYYSIGLGYTAASYTEPPAEIAAVSTSSSGGTTADIIFGTRSVTTNTAVTERMRITSDGKIGIGNTAPIAMMHIRGDGDLLRLVSTNAGTSGAQLDLIHFSASPADNDTVGVINFSGYDGGNNPTQYASIKGEATSISSEYGELNFGIRQDSSNFHHNRLTMNRTYNQFVGEHGDGYKASLMVTPDGGTNDIYSGIAFKATFGSYPADTTPRRAADIWGGFTGTWDTEFLAFGVGNAGSGNDSGNLTDEKMRLDASGGLRIGTTVQIFNSIEDERLSVKNSENGSAATFEATDLSGGYPVIYVRDTDSDTGSHYALYFYRTNTAVGSITTSTTATAYNTSSDYRLKENVVAIDNAIDRVKQLSTYRFNFIAEANTTVDGFLAHEVADIVPEAVSGEKDAVKNVYDAESNTTIEVAEYQGIDQSKLVPLLTAALNEAILRIETLESTVANTA